MAFPEWVEKQKRRGYEIKCIRGQYYMYRLKSKWDPKRKKAKKVSGEYIGKVTPDGVVPKKKRVVADAPVYSLEVGATAFVLTIAGDVRENLRGHFGEALGDRIFAASMLRLITPCPFCRVGDRYETSWMSKAMPGLPLSPSSLTFLLDAVGGNRAACAAFMRETMGASPYYLVDGTRTVSASGDILRAVPGHSKTKGFLPQVNQIYVMAVSGEDSAPAFYRNVAGNIPDVTALGLTVEDARIGNATFVGDTGFGSEVNFAALSDSGLAYIVPLKRNTVEVDIPSVAFDGVFSYHHRTIRSHETRKDGYRICVFRDEKLRGNELTDFVERAEKANAATVARKSYNPDKDVLRDVATETAVKDAEFGVIVIRTSDMDATVQEIYEAYKMRWEIEQLFDTMRNVCENDASYMHDDAGFEAWSFVGHVTLMVACRVLALLKKKKMVKQWSLAGVMDHLSRIHAVLVADEWKIAETTKKTRELVTKLGFELPSQVAYHPND